MTTHSVSADGRTHFIESIEYAADGTCSGSIERYRPAECPYCEDAE